MKISTDVMLSGTFTTDQTSLPFTLEGLYGFAIQASFGGTAPVGILKVQGTCNDPADPSVTPVWDDETQTAPIAAAGTAMLNFDHRYYRFFRVVLTVTSGTIAIVVRFAGKGP